MPIYMKIEDIEGGATAKGFEKCIPVQSVHLNANRSVSSRVGGMYERTVGSPNLGQLVLTKEVDQASPYLFVESCTGKAKDTVVIDFCRTDSGQASYKQYILSDVLIANYDANSSGSLGSDSGDINTIETIVLNYSKLEISFTARDGDNKELAPIRAGYDLKTGQKT